jgi:hypothetical protein
MGNNALLQHIDAIRNRSDLSMKVIERAITLSRTKAAVYAAIIFSNSSAGRGPLKKSGSYCLKNKLTAGIADMGQEIPEFTGLLIAPF